MMLSVITDYLYLYTVFASYEISSIIELCLEIYADDYYILSL